uniref:Glutamate decarboxylase n=1 Tax=Cannabis sativa TaxID=3483 RepID=A0A803Q3E6_CANSA
MINDELMLDGKPRLNLASFVTTWMEPECDKLVMDSMNKNYVDMDEYPVTTELQNRCVNMIAHLFHAPLDETEAAVGVGTVGSSEAIMLAGLAFKRKWQNKRKAEGKPYDNPNIVTGANVQVCWEKFARYFEVELKEVKVKEGYYVMDPVKAVEMVDENTICVAAILGSTYNGEFEDVKLLNDLLLEKNKQTGWETPIHVDAASGGFIAPFLYPELEWDFRLPLVKSINVSGHKYGLVYAGVGWVVWRTQQDLPEELIFHINYLGADQPTFTLNFSKGSSQIIAQYYQLIRLGFEGYRNIMENCHKNAMVLKQGLEKTGRFEILSKDIGVPVVAFSLKDRSRHDEFEVSELLRRFGWIVPAYTMPADARHVSLLRVVIREDFSRTLAERLVIDISKVLQELDKLPAKNGKSSTSDDEVDVTKKREDEIKRNIATHWRNIVMAKKANKMMLSCS